MQQHESGLKGADFMSGRCSLICKSFFAYVEASLQREKANVFPENWKMTQSMCIIYICWKIQLLSTNQIAASGKGKSKIYYTMRTKQVLPLATATKAKGWRERWYCVRRPTEARCTGYFRHQTMSPATVNCFPGQGLRCVGPWNYVTAQTAAEAFPLPLHLIL